MLTGLVCLAFWNGNQQAEIKHLKESVTSRFGVQISVEADRRLTLLEHRVDELEHR
jgi:hypothetical protein